MRWRLSLFFLSLTAAFCFLLLTAVTDYGTTGAYRPPMVAGASQGRLLSSAMPAPAVAEEVKDSAAAHTLAAARFDIRIRPNTAGIFVARDADPVRERHEREKRGEQPAKGKRVNRLKHDEFGWYREEHALVTAYCPCAKCCGTQSPGITSIGKSAWTPGLAADPMKLVYGTRVFIPDYGLSVVDDTGGAMRRHWRRDGVLHIDVRMTYHYEARQWGKKYIRVKIYDEE